MKNAILLILFTTCALFLGCDKSPKSRRITVDKASFSEVYPAVWFNPSTGAISPLLTKSEEPPNDGFEIWIEPRDAEIQIAAKLKQNSGQKIGFVPLGDGDAVFHAASSTSDPKPERVSAQIDKNALLQKKTVFRYFGTTSDCVLMIEEVDRAKQLIKFKWKSIQE